VTFTRDGRAAAAERLEVDDGAQPVDPRRRRCPITASRTMRVAPAGSR
jgi:hypothetical protein